MRHHWTLSLAGLGLLGCATASSPSVTTSTSDEAVVVEAPAPDAAPAVATPPEAPAPPAAPAPSAAPTPVPPATVQPSVTSSASERTAEGIDDQNWMPRADTAAYAALTAANELLRADPRAASARFAAAATSTPGFYGAWFNAGVAAELAGDRAAAEAHYREALRVRPDHGPTLVTLSTLWLTNGRTDEAERLVADATRQAPNRPGPHVAAAVLALRLRDLVGAEKAAREALSFDERNVAAMHVLAQVFRGQGRLDTARFAVENALALEPGNALLHLERGHILLAQNERREALLAYERASRLRPSLADALEPYGRLLLERGFVVEARSTLDALVKLRPGSGIAWLVLGNAQRAAKAYPDAAASYQKALELDPGLHEAHFNIGLLAIDNAVGDGDELVRLQKAVESLKTYQSKARPDVATQARLTEYIESTEKRISREAKRRERDRKRQADDAAKAQAQPSPPTSSTPEPSPSPETPPATAPAPESSPVPATSTSAGPPAASTSGGTDAK